MSPVTEILHSAHRRVDFNCGNESLNHYLRHQASQDIKRKLSACFVMVDRKQDLIQGYYTLSNFSIPQDLIPVELSRKLPASYPFLPSTLLGRLAVDLRYQGEGIGKSLLIDALLRSYELSNIMGSFAIIVDPINQEAETFYEKSDFIKLPGSGKMFLPMKTIGKLFDFN